MSDTPWEVCDWEVGLLREVGIYCGMVAHRTQYRRWWSLPEPFGLGYILTQEGTDEILARINGFGPHRFEDTWESVERRDDLSFWRSQL